MLVDRQAIPLEITIAKTASDGSLTLVEELQLVKAALLYADRVVLASPAAAAVRAATQLLEADSVEQHRRLLRITAPLMDPGIRDMVPLLTHRRFRRQFAGYQDLKQGLDAGVLGVTAVVKEIASTSHLEELQPAISAGLLEIDPLSIDPVSFLIDAVLSASGKEPTEGTRDAAVASMVARVSAAVSPASLSLPLFDDGASRLAAAIEALDRSRVSRRPASEAGLARLFVGSMPAVADAAIPEVIDVRRALDRPLIRFRAAMATMARDLETAAWDEGFRAAADSLYRSEVEPALLELEEIARDSRAPLLLGRAALSGRPWAAAGATLMLGLASASWMPDLAALAMSAGSSVAFAAAAAAEAAKEGLRLRREAERNRFVFLFRADEALREMRNTR